MNNNSTIVWVVVVLLILIGVVVLTKDRDVPNEIEVNLPGENGGNNMNSTSTATSTPSTATSTSATIKSFTVNAQNFSFSPSSMTVKKGDTVKINFVNSGGKHDFKIDEFNVATAQIDGGQSQTVQFVADKTGSFEYYCSVANHRAMGMKGTLTVTE